MKQLFYIVSIVLMTTIAFVSCKGTTNKTNSTESGMPDFIGTWHYETVTQAVLGAVSDTVVFDYINNPHEQQFYEVYTPDSIMTFYTIQNDTLLNKLRFRYAFRNDTLYMSDPNKPVQTVHVKSFTDNTVTIDYIRTYRDTLFYCTSTMARYSSPASQAEVKIRPSRYLLRRLRGTRGFLKK